MMDSWVEPPNQLRRYAVTTNSGDLQVSVAFPIGIDHDPGIYGDFHVENQL